MGCEHVRSPSNPANEFDFWGEHPADMWRYEQFWDRFATAAEPTDVPPVHAYSHANTLSSAAMAYAVTGARRYLAICNNAYEYIVKKQCYATGGFGDNALAG